MKTTHKIILGIILGFLLGFGSAWIWLSAKIPIGNDFSDNVEDLKSEEELLKDESGKTDATEPDAKEAGSDIISVSDQEPGNVVVVEKLSLKEASWVVIYEDENGEPGNILGAGIFNEGTVSGSVELLRATESGKDYYAVIHFDNGDRQFDYLTDLVDRDETTGKLVLVKFRAF